MAKGAPVSCKALVRDGTCAAHSQKRPEVIGICRKTLFKGSSKKFYRLNIIFWIGIGCGIAPFGWRGLKTT